MNERYASLLRELSERAGLPTTRQLLSRPNIQAVYRLTLSFADHRAADVISTVYRLTGAEARAEFVYRGLFDNRPLARPLTEADYRTISDSLRPTMFDKLPDQPDIATFGLDLCLVERGAGGFLKDVVIAPSTATGSYAQIIAAFRATLPEAFREVQP